MTAPHLRRALRLASLVAAALAAACSRDEPRAGAPPASAAPSALPRPSERTEPAVAPKPAPLPCRALSVDGAITTSSGHVASGNLIVEGSWLSLGKDGRLTLKHPESGRETGFEGPGKLRPCVRFGEETWLAQGTFRSTPATGEAPGAEQWIVVPWGVVRYASGLLEVKLAETGGDVELRTAAAFVLLAPEARASASPDGRGDEGGWARFDPPAREPPDGQAPIERASEADAGRAGSKKERRVRIVTGPLDAAPAVKRCEAASEEAHQLAAAIQIAGATPGGRLGDLARKHVAARELARAHCAVARLRVSMLAEPNRDLEGRALAADARWRELP